MYLGSCWSMVWCGELSLLLLVSPLGPDSLQPAMVVCCGCYRFANTPQNCMFCPRALICSSIWQALPAVTAVNSAGWQHSAHLAQWDKVQQPLQQCRFEVEQSGSHPAPSHNLHSKQNGQQRPCKRITPSAAHGGHASTCCKHAP